MKQRRTGEEGHLMAALMAAIAIMVIFSMVVFRPGRTYCVATTRRR
jgi:hypothetical protein